jgi:hypothetical protein
MKRSWLIAAALLALAFANEPAKAQVGLTITPIDAPTINGSVKITTGNTLQSILGAQGFNQALKSVTFQNNNSTDNCWIVFGSNITITSGTTTLSTNVTVNGVTMTVQQAAILLTPGGSFQRYLPYLPADQIFGTCATTGDSIHIDYQQ